MPRCVTGTPGLPGAEGGSRDPRPDSLPHAVPTALGSGGQAGPPLPAGASARSRERREAGARRDGALTGEAAPLHRQRGAACPPLPLPLPLPFSALRYTLAWGRGGPSTAAARDQPSRAAGPAGGSCWRERERDHPGRQHTALARLLAAGPGGVCPSQQCMLGAVVPVPGLAAGRGGRERGTAAGRTPSPGPLPSERQQGLLVTPHGPAGTGTGKRITLKGPQSAQPLCDASIPRKQQAPSSFILKKK